MFWSVKKANMKTFLLRFGITLAVLAGLWFVFSRIPAKETFHSLAQGKFDEEKFGELAMDAVFMESKELRSDSIDFVMNRLVNRLSEGNLFPASKFHIHVVNNNEVNAFALPGNHVVVHSGLIYMCDNPEELLGVLAHEIAHLEKRHVYERMKTEGIITLIEGAVAQGGGATIATAVGELAGLAFSRDQESEADEVGFNFLMNANVRPNGMATLFRKMKEETLAGYTPEFMSTHPELESRALNIESKCAGLPNTFVPVMSAEEWENFQINLRLAL
jgi:predicted Zn-dependent protease